MIYYISVFLILATLNFAKYFEITKNFLFIINISCFTLIVIFTGFRFNVGADWNTYFSLFNQFKEFGFPSIQIFTSSDPIYITLNILSHRTSNSIYLVNLLIAFLFFISLYFLIQNQEDKLISILSSFLLVVIILNMGYARQALAVSFILFFFIFFIKKKYLTSSFFVILSILSHKTSILVFGLIFLIFLLSNLKFLKIKYFFLVFFLSLIFFYYYRIDITRMIELYVYKDIPLHITVKQKMTSEGVLPKILYILPYILIFFVFKKIKFINNNEKYIFHSLIFFVILSIPFLGYFSSLVDRILVYIYVLPSLIVPKVLEIQYFQDKKKKFNLEIVVIIYSFLSVVTWLMYANHSDYWVNYQNILFNSIE